jgi:hypothetical protein
VRLIAAAPEPAEPSVPADAGVTDAVERATRAWCVSRGLNPDCLHDDEHGQDGTRETYSPIGQPIGQVRQSRAWRKHAPHIRTALAPILAELAQARADARTAVDLLDTLFGLYEDGDPVYDEPPEDGGGSIGTCINLDDETYHACCDLLTRLRPRPATQARPTPGENG